MKRNILVFVSILLLASVTIIIMAQQKDDNGRNRLEAANTGLKNLVALADEETAKMAGISLDKLRTARLGNPLSLQYINAREVVKADGFTSISNYLMPNTEYYYPVEADGAIIASVEVVQNKDGRWIPGQLGGFKTAQGVNNIINQVIKNDTAITRDRLRVFHSGPHGVLFIGFEKGGQQYLTPVLSRPDIGLRAGQVLTEQETLQRLKDIYKNVDMDLPD
jgi:hypothetical protein